jgi:hypothetical protein
MVLNTAMLMMAGTVCAAPELHCHIEQADTVKELRFSTVSNPYAVAATDINRRFRFKAVVVGNEAEVQHISLYTYYITSGQPVLMHEVKYLHPEIQKSSHDKSLTGIVYLYSPVLGREMKYDCALRREEQ